MNAGGEADTQVAVVGGGPVGMGLAITLAQHGIRATVIERHEQPQPIPKGQNLTQRTMEHFYFWGAEQALRKARTIPRDFGIGGVTAYGSLLSPYHYDWLQRELVRPYYFTDNERLPQYATEKVLRERAAALANIETLYGWTAEDVSQDRAGAYVTIAPRAGGAQRMLRAEYVIGCDGSRSITRERAGITQTRTDHDRLMVLLVFRSQGLHDQLQRFPGKSFFCVLHPELKGYWRFFGRVDLGTTWFFHAPVPPGTTEHNYDFRRLLHEAAGAAFDVEFEHIGFWDLRFAVADSYRAGRVFVAGDAAHSHPPYGGYGINLGFEDAVNLGWKLAAALQGWAGPRLLDSYDAERRPVFQSTSRHFIEGAIEVDRAFLASFDPQRDRDAFEQHWRERAGGARSEVGAFEPNYEGSPVVWGPPHAACSAVGGHARTARAGHHLAPCTLSSGRNIFEELGDGFTLLALDAPESTMASFAAAARALNMPLNVIADTRGDGRENYAAALVLIRPDQFVAWVSADLSIDAGAVLGRAAGFD